MSGMSIPGMGEGNQFQLRPEIYFSPEHIRLIRRTSRENPLW